MEDKLGQKIRKLRESHEMTMDDLAEKSGLSMDHIGRVERGETKNVGIETIGKIAHALGTTTRDLICDDEPDQTMILTQTAN